MAAYWNRCRATEKGAAVSPGTAWQSSRRGPGAVGERRDDLPRMPGYEVACPLSSVDQFHPAVHNRGRKTGLFGHWNCLTAYGPDGRIIRPSTQGIT